jgi:hypothetical protein
MKQQEGRMKWLIAIASLVAGAIWLAAALGDGLNVLYLAVALVLLLGGGAWLLSLSSSSRNSERPGDRRAE